MWYWFPESTEAKKRGDQQIRVRPQCGGAGGRAGIYFRKTCARHGTPFMAHSVVGFKPNLLPATVGRGFG
jgi:hypothetical protein